MNAFYYPITHTAPEILSLASAKKQLKMEDLGTFDDDIIQECIDAAIMEAQNYINTAILEAKWKINLTAFVQDFEPKKQRINSIDKVTYTLEDGTAAPFTTAGTIADVMELLPVDRYATRLSWLGYDDLPDLIEDSNSAVSIEVTVGYTSTTIPKDMLQAIKLLVTDNYNFRNSRGRNEAYKDSSRILLEPYKYYV